MLCFLSSLKPYSANFISEGKHFSSHRVGVPGNGICLRSSVKFALSESWDCIKSASGGFCVRLSILVTVWYRVRLYVLHTTSHHMNVARKIQLQESRKKEWPGNMMHLNCISSYAISTVSLQEAFRATITAFMTGHLT